MRGQTSERWLGFGVSQLRLERPIIPAFAPIGWVKDSPLLDIRSVSSRTPGARETRCSCNGGWKHAQGPLGKAQVQSAFRE